MVKHFSIKKVYLLFDREGKFIQETNTPKQSIIDKAENRIISMLDKDIEVYKCRLPLLGKDKMDIDEFIRLSSSPTKDLLEVLNEGEYADRRNVC